MATPAPTRPVVVGVDGTPEARLALSWALDEAELRGRPVRVVTVSEWPTPSPLAAPPFAGDLPAEGEPSAFLQDVYEEALAFARERLSADRVSGDSLVGSATPVLLDESAGAELVVVGSRARSPAAAVLLGSVSTAVAAHARCPVAVVRPAGEAAASRRVVVGVDESGHADGALEFAFDEAALRGLPLHVVHCWQPFQLVDPAVWTPDQTLAEQRDREDWLAEKVGSHAEKRPDVETVLRVVDTRPVTELVEQSRTADLVIAGTRGHGGFVGMLLGSVSQGLLHHSHSTVVVVRERS